MPRSYWRIIIACLGFLILANAAQDKDHRGQDGQKPSHTQQMKAATPTIKPTRRAEPTKPDQPQCVNEYGQQEDCSTASAQATIDQAGYAFWQTIAGVFGVLVGVGTLIAAIWAGSWAKKAALHTETSAKEGSRAANAAEQALGHAREISTAQLRPYLFIDKIEAENQTPDAEAFRLYQLVIWYRNFGTTPARDIRIWSDCYTSADIAKLKALNMRVDPVQAGAAAPGHHRRSFETIFVNDDEVRQFEDNEIYAILRVHYQYRDDAGQEYQESVDYHTRHTPLQNNTFFLLTDSRRNFGARAQGELFSARTGRRRRRRPNHKPPK